jgi:UDP-N-acetyl-D-mannosaminuronic acid dehydrogenase
MSFKAQSDDIRSSLSYKLRRVLKFKAKAVLSTDPFVPEDVDDTLLPLELVLEKADVLVIATPHPEYKSIVTDKPVADVWNVLGNGVLV